jgi:hypothetical protein
MMLLPLAGLLFFDFHLLVCQRRLALHQKGCRGRKVALVQPWRSSSVKRGREKDTIVSSDEQIQAKCVMVVVVDVG